MVSTLSLRAFLERPYDLDTIIHFFLTGITSGAGLGFSRCALFLADNDDVFKGCAAVGSVTRQESEHIWAVSDENTPLDDLLVRAGRLIDDLKSGRAQQSPLSEAVRGLSLTRSEEGGAFGECLRTEHRAIRGWGEADSFRLKLAEFMEQDGNAQAFACVPLVGGQGRIVGVLVVDNKYLLGESSIDDEQLDSLELYSRLLALSIDNARLRERIAENQGHNLVHTIQKRIGGARDCLTMLQGHPEYESDQSDLARDMREIHATLEDHLTEATRIFTQFQAYLTPPKPRSEDIDLNVLAESLGKWVAPDVLFDLRLAEEGLIVQANNAELRNICLELLRNADEAMNGYGNPKRITIRTERVRGEADVAILEVADNGPGVRDEWKNAIFDPFFSEDKENGIGLGLANARTRILAWGGKIWVTDNAGGGARFVVELPLRWTDDQDSDRGQ